MALRHATCLLVAAFATSAAASEWPKTPWLNVGKNGWIPSVAATGGALIQDQASSVESSCANGGEGRTKPPGVDIAPFAACLGLLAPGPAALRPSAVGGETTVSPTVGFDAQLLTPSIPQIPGSPRLYVRGELEMIFGSTRSIANNGEPSGAELPEFRNFLYETPSDALTGQGSRVSSEFQTLSYGGGAGIAFPFQFLGRTLWIKPGAAWSRYSMNITGIVEAGLKNDPQNPLWRPPPTIPGEPIPGDQQVYGTELRIVSLRKEVSQTFDGIGPSLELEMDVGHFGPVGASLFVGASAYRILGDREVEFSQTLHADQLASVPNPPNYAPTCTLPLNNMPPVCPGVSYPRPKYPALPADDYDAKWKFEVEPWIYRAHVGFRLHWYGFVPGGS